MISKTLGRAQPQSISVWREIYSPALTRRERQITTLLEFHLSPAGKAFFKEAEDDSQYWQGCIERDVVGKATHSLLVGTGISTATVAQYGSSSKKLKLERYGRVIPSWRIPEGTEVSTQ